MIYWTFYVIFESKVSQFYMPKNNKNKTTCLKGHKNKFILSTKNKNLALQIFQPKIVSMSALKIAQQYYDCFNKQNWEGMLALLHTDIRHEPNQGDVRMGLEKFKDFLKMMDESYEETLSDMVFLTENSETRVACEFTVNGIYKKGEEGLPEAKGQKYVLPAAAFLEVKDGKISRITTYYNLPLWIKLVSE